MSFKMRKETTLIKIPRKKHCNIHYQMEKYCNKYGLQHQMSYLKVGEIGYNKFWDHFRNHNQLPFLIPVSRVLW